MTDDELLALLDDPESDRSERKAALTGDTPSALREALCAFANDLPGHGKPGVAFIGVKNDGQPTHLPIDDKLLAMLGGIRDEASITPPLSLTVEKRKLKGADVAVVMVFPSMSPPVRYKGRIWIRTGPRRGIANPQDERVLNERRRHRDIPFDVYPVPSSDIGDLNRQMFDAEYLPALVSPDVLAQNERSFEQKLASAKMVARADEPVPTVLGHLVLGIRTRDFIPGAYIQFLRIAGSEITDAIFDEAVLDGTVSETIRRTEEKLRLHNTLSVDFTSQALEVRRSAYPIAALEQLVRNAVMHRSYESTNAPVRVTWYDNYIEIFSPGGPFGSVTETNFGQPGVTDYRNPNLAEALKAQGYVQKFGAGIATAKRQLAENGNPPPTFDVSASAVVWKIGARP